MHPAPHRRVWRSTVRTVLMLALSAGVLAPAAPAAASTRVRDVTIDCAGNVVAGHVTITDPGKGSVLVQLYGSRHSSSKSRQTKLGETTIKTTVWENEVPYSFTLPDHSWKYYRVKATIGSSKRVSAAVGDPTCAPPTAVDEAGVAGLVLLVMGAAAGGVVYLRRRSALPVPGTASA